MPVFDFSAAPADKNETKSQCTYTTFRSNETEATPEKPVLILDNSRRDYFLQILRIEKTDEPFAFSCLPYTAEEIENATHHEELPPARRTVLCVCGAVRGVGGIDSWGSDVEEAYRINAENVISYSFAIC